MSKSIDENKLWNKMLQYLLAGGAVGGSLALGTGLYKHYKNTLENQDSSSDDDDVLYIQKQSNVPDGWGLGAFGLGTILSYMLGSNLMNKYRKAQAQKALDEAQSQFLGAQGYQVISNKDSEESLEKHAVVDTADSLGTAMGVLMSVLGIGGGLAAYHYLDNEYPLVEPSDDGYPKRIKVVKGNRIKTISNDGDPYTETDARQIVNELNKSAAENMNITTYVLHSMYKKASIASNIINTVASGQGAQFENAVNQIGFKNSLNLVKGASALKVNPVAEALAIEYCTKQASFAPQFNLLAAAEFINFNPNLVKQAKELDLQQKYDVNYMSKQASVAFALHTAADMNATEDVASVDTSDVSVKDAMLYTINKIAASSLITNNNAVTASELSGGGVAEASKKDPELLSKESNLYKQVMDSKKTDTFEDPIDGSLEAVMQDNQSVVKD